MTSSTSDSDRKLLQSACGIETVIHGMAINIQNDLSIFDLLIPCGLDGVEMTSVLKETGKQHSMSQLKQNLGKLLIKHFSKASQDSEDRRQKPVLSEVEGTEDRSLSSDSALRSPRGSCHLGCEGPYQPA